MLSDREKRISGALESGYDEKTARAFRGGIEVLEHTNEDRVCQSAHSLREVLEMIYKQEKTGGRGVSGGEDEGRNKKGFGRNLAAVMNRGPQPTQGDILYKKIAKNRDLLNKVAHHGGDQDESRYVTIVDEYETLLEELVEPHFKTLGDVERLIKTESPTRADFEDLERLLSKNGSLYEYFFQNAGPGWLARLAKEGYLSGSSAPEKRGGRSVLADRSRAAYLARCAEGEPEQAADLLAGMLEAGGGSQDPMVQLHAARAALAMPPDCARRIARQVRPGRRGHPLSGSIAVQEIGDVAVHLAELHADDAARLAGRLLSVAHQTRFVTDVTGDFVTVHGSTEPVVGSYYFGRVLKGAVPLLFDRAPVQATGMLVRCLARIIHLENVTRPEGERNGDASPYWRPAIEDHPNNPSGFKSDLVGAIGRLLLRLGEKSVAELKEALRAMAKKRYPVFRRIELYVYRNLPEAFADEINAAVEARFGMRELWREYLQLVGARFKHLPEATRKRYLDRVMDGPGESYVARAGELEREGTGPPAAEAVRHWKADRLAPVGDQLTEAEKLAVGGLAQERLPGRLGFAVQHGQPRVGVIATPLGEGMGPDEVIEAVRSYHDRRNAFGDGDGTPERFQEYCESDPEGYSARASALTGLHPRIRAAFLGGMQAAAAKKKGVEWDGVLDLCISTARSVRDGSALFSDEAEALDAAAELLRTALDKDRIAYSKREAVWSLLEGMAALGDEESGRAWEERMSQVGGDAVSALLNTVGGMTFLAVAEYAVWCSKHAGKKLYFPPEVKRLFAEYIGGDIRNTPPKHAAVGHVLPLLYWYDKGWIQGKVQDIFGNGTGAFARAAWTGYLANSPDRDSFGDMVGMYRADVASPRRPSADDGPDFMPYSESLITHVTQGHLLRMGEADGLFEDMAKGLNKSGRSHCAWVVYWILKANNDNPCESLDRERFKEVWEDGRFAFNEFLNVWVKFSPLDQGATLELLHGSLEAATDDARPMFLIRELRPFIDQHPEGVLTCLKDIVYSEHLNEEIRLAGDDLPGMLKTLLEDRATRRRATDLVNRVGELGYNEYGYLLGGIATGGQGESD